MDDFPVDPVDDATVADVARIAGRRLQDVKGLSSGHHFILANAKHVGSGREALLVISRPSDPDGFVQLSKISSCLALVSDSGLATVLDKFWPEPATWGCLVLTWHRGSGFEDVLIAKRGAPRPNIIRTLLEICKQLESMHRAGFAHGDVSSSNIIVDDKGKPHLIDFEYTTNDRIVFDQEAFGTAGFSHPDRLARIRSAKYDFADLVLWDCYAFGNLIFQVLGDASPYFFTELSLYNQRALRLLACQLMDGHNSGADQRALGLEEQFFKENKVRDMGIAASVLERILGDTSVDSHIQELKWIPEHVLEAGTIAPAPLTRRVRKLLATKEMQQLSECQQLGLISFIWPAATHTRLEHALGTFSLACVAVSNLFDDPQSPFFKVLIDDYSAKALLLAALLHDIGHYPLAHDIEEAWRKDFDHESRSISIIQDPSKGIREIIEAPESSDGTGGWGVRSADVASILKGAPLDGSSISRSLCELLNSIISGTLDVDKLDYLVRDSRVLSVRAGEGIDVRRILSQLTIVVVPNELRRGPGNKTEYEFRLGVRAKGIRPAELVGRVRSHMFGVVYWHRSYRAIKAMMHWIIWDAISRVSDGAHISKRDGVKIAQRLFQELDKPSMLSGFHSDASTYWMPRKEAEVLEFFSQLGGSSSRKMLAVLGARRWYDSILTIEHYENIAKWDSDESARAERAWDAAERLPVATPDWVSARMHAAGRVQARLITWLDGRTEGDVFTTVADWDSQKSRFLIAASSEQLFLLDLVQEDKSNEKGRKRLYFAAVERSDAKSADSSKPLPIRVSYDHAMLEDEFMASNGAIRLFCHPDHSDFIVRSVPRAFLMDLVSEELDTAGLRNRKD